MPGRGASWTHRHGRVMTMAYADNPFFAPSTLPYQLPPFDRIEDEHYLPAFERGIEEQRAEISKITDNPAAPTVDNTLVALETSGQLLQRVSAVFFNQVSSDTNDELQRIQREVAPRLAAHQDAIHLDPALFERLSSLYENRASLGLDPETHWLLERYHRDFVRAGATLDAAAQNRLRAINEELSELSTAFQQNLLADTNDSAVMVDDVEELDGMSDEAIAAAAEAARSRGAEGKYVLDLVLPTAKPCLAWLTNRP